MVRKALVAALIAWAVAGGGADAEENVELGLTMGEVVGSEQICGYTIDQKKLEEFILDKVDADDAEFSYRVARGARLMPGDYERMSRSAKTTHCVQMRRLVKTYGIDG